ncbi:unnamed protein product [Miscanthus lutarioriparius]|uniref:Uncharacterized protein n=1 Tax=Miscanthus lutarioriparius TaxID=422564 RepID=A0A811Q2C5_9POAL|nr:unnamed protein product [Miscanthus lutarioriparius]
MRGGGSPIAGGARRHKVLAPWRFQSGFVRREMNAGVLSDGKSGGLETLQMSCQTATSDVPSVSLNDGSGVDGERPATDGEIEVPNNRGGGAVDGENRGLGSVDGNPAAKEADSLPKDGGFPVGLENDGVTADPHGMAKPAISRPHKGCKTVVPWRFQIGYEPKWPQGLSSGNRSNGEAEDPTSKVGDGSRKDAPAMARNHSRLKGSATSGRSSVRIPEGTGSAPKKRKIDKDDQYEATANNRISVVGENVLTTLLEFRIIYKKLLEEEQIKWRERGHGLSPDLAAFNIFRERFCANYDDLKYDGSIPGVRIGDVFNSVMELYIVGIHRAQSLAVDHIKKKDGTCLAVSVVSYAQPSAFDSLDFLLHVGSVTDTCDQEMEGTDMALKESMDTDTPVRVVHAVVTDLVSQKCACTVKNGGGFHFNDIGGLTEGKPLIYECGPSCKCPPTCRNRVSQHGIKFRLQVFKTKSMGWGVRTLDFIPDGSFVCEYVGELLTDEEAQERKNDEYLFAIGNSYYDAPHWKAEIKAIPSLQNGPSEDDETVFAVALNRGNFARFINHCCTPNLFPQNVLHDHDNISMPHIMFFASEDIPPLKKLSYDYNYQIDKVYDSDGNIKMKHCFCGSNECNGRLY